LSNRFFTHVVFTRSVPPVVSATLLSSSIVMQSEQSEPILLQSEVSTVFPLTAPGSGGSGTRRSKLRFRVESSCRSCWTSSACTSRPSRARLLSGVFVAKHTRRGGREDPSGGGTKAHTHTERETNTRGRWRLLARAPAAAGLARQRRSQPPGAGAAAAPPACRAAATGPTPLPGRFHPQFREQNRRDIGKSQPEWTMSKMETPGSPAAPLPAVVGAATDEEKAETPGGGGGLASSGGLV
jgi:hypothetical protein